MSFILPLAAALPLGFIIFQWIRYQFWLLRDGQKLLLPWPDKPEAYSPFANRRRTRDLTLVRTPSEEKGAILFVRRPRRFWLGPMLFDQLTGSTGILGVLADCGHYKADEHFLITSDNFRLRRLAINGPQFIPREGALPAASVYVSLVGLDTRRFRLDLEQFVAERRTVHRSSAPISVVLGLTQRNRVTCSGMIGRAILNQTGTPLARALQQALRERYTYGEITPADIASAVAILGLRSDSGVPIHRVPACSDRVRRLTALAALPLMAGVLYIARSQSAASSLPFAVVPLTQAISADSGITLSVRQPDGSYATVRFGIAQPYGLMSSIASLAGIISGATKFTMNAPVAPPNTALASQWLALGDFTGDGSPGAALFTGNLNSTLAVYEGTPGFLFRGATNISLSGNLGQTLAAADLNRDGKADLVVSYSEPNSVPGAIAVYLNNGDGTFTRSATYAPGAFWSSLCVLDVNRDGIPDIVAAGWANRSSVSSGSYGELAVMLGKGDGTFSPPTTTLLPSTSYEAVSVTSADFNGDSVPDLAVAANDAIYIFAGDGRGGFSNLANFASREPAPQLAVGDLNGDGKADMVTVSQGVASIYLGAGHGTFTYGRSYSVHVSPSVILADYNHDGKLDVVMGTGDQRGFGPAYYTGAIEYLAGNGDGSFQGVEIFTTPAPNATNLLVTADFNGDGNLDAIVNTASQLYLFAGIGGGRFQAPTLVGSVPSLCSPAAAVTGDFNSDGRPDLVVVCGYTGSFEIFLSSPTGLQAPIALLTGGQNPTHVVAGDWNGDGKLDLAVINSAFLNQTAGSSLGVFLGNGNGTFQAGVQYPAGQYPNGLASADMNGDGLPDLVVAAMGLATTGSGDGAVHVFLNSGGGRFRDAFQSPMASFPAVVTIADLNKDGKPDVIVGGYSGGFKNYLATLLGNGDGSLGAPAFASVSAQVESIAAADFEGSGKTGVVYCRGQIGPGYLAGNGDGTFQPENDFYATLDPFDIHVADLTGTGTHDLIIGLGASFLNPSYLTSSGVMAIFNSPAMPLATVNGASFNTNQTVAPNSIASSFGSHLTASGATTVAITDGAGTLQSATVLSASDAQVNFLVPPTTAIGSATIVITPPGGLPSRGSVTIAPVAPGLFTAGGSLANGFFVTVDSEGNQSTAFTVQLDPNHAGQFLPVPIPLSSVAAAALELFGTGIRGASQSQVGVFASFRGGGIAITPAYAGPQPQFAGEDQINVLLPATLKGAGDVSLTITASGQSSNTVHITVQ